MQRQLREMLGRERDRLDKVWLVTDDAPPAPRAARRRWRPRRRCTSLRVPRAALARLAAAGAGQRAGGPPLHRRPDGRVDDARAGRRRPGTRQARPRAAAARLGRLGPAPAAETAGAMDRRRPAAASTSRPARCALAAAGRLAAWSRCCRWRGCGCASAARRPPARLAALTALTLFLTFDLVVFGAFTRLTDSGLGCPDWPGCYGEASPLGARDDIHAAQTALPTGPVTWSQGLDRDDPPLPGDDGGRADPGDAAVVSWRARAARLPHLALVADADAGLGDRAGAVRQVHGDAEALPGHRHAAPAGRAGAAGAAGAAARGLPRPAAGAGRPALRRGARGVALALLVVQMALGGWVSTNYAVLACTGFPHLQRPVVAGDGLRPRLHAAARAGPRRARRLPAASTRWWPSTWRTGCSRWLALAALAGAGLAAVAPAPSAAARRFGWRWRRCCWRSWPAACPTSCWAGRSSRRWAHTRRRGGAGAAAAAAAGAQRAGAAPPAAPARAAA